MCTSGDSTMLTSANQYLRPEYLPPVSSPLDANKSPLALLAKTCSSIGVDTPSVKSLTGSSSSNSSSSSSANSSSNERRTTPKSKSTDSNETSSKLNFKPYELSSKSKSSDADKATTDKTTPTSGASAAHKHRGSSPGNTQSSPDLQKQQANSSSSSAPLSYTSLGLPDMHKDSLAAFYKAYGFLSPNCCPTTPGSPYTSLMPPPITLDKTGAYPSIYPPTPSATAAAALAAYNYNYARVKGGMAGMAHVPGASNPLCRDPYCGGACGQYGQLHNSHAAAASLLAASQASLALRESVGITSIAGQSFSGTTCTPATCPNGCNQCEHQRYLAAIAAAYGGSFPGMPYPQMSASYASSLATAAALHHRVASAGGTLCNWVVGDTHCGKRFATPEELLQHLKSHTASSQNPESGSSPSTATSTAPSPAHRSTSNSPAVTASQQHQHQHLSNSGTRSPLSQSTRHSSNSSAAAVSPTLSLHSNRYHPYSKPISSVAPSLPPTALQSAPYHLGPGGAGASPYGAHFGLSPAASLSSFPASNLYYPYMTPSLFSGRIGPPVPP